MAKQKNKATPPDTLAKAGMITSMAAAAYSGFAGGKLARLLHPWAGLAVIFFSIWHHQSQIGKKRAKPS